MTQTVSDTELAVTVAGPAVLTNKFFVGIGPHGVRVTFAEQTGPTMPPVFRSAVVMSLQDGIALYRLLQELLADAEKHIESAASPAGNG
jgi:hypothetical protein